jgi:hypothetical protein
MDSHVDLKISAATGRVMGGEQQIISYIELLPTPNVFFMDPSLRG